MAYDGRGPAATCVNLLSGMVDEGLRCSVHLDRKRAPIAGVPSVAAVPSPLSFISYQFIRRLASRRSERRYLGSLAEGDVAYLWPAASLETHQTVFARGNPIVLEGINTRMKAAREVLDEAYGLLGAEPTHGITDQRIEEEDEKLALASYFFAPSKGVEDALVGSPLDPSRIISASYGTSLSYFQPGSAGPGSERCRILFVGSVCVRKGAHLLLEAWDQLDLNAELILAGGVEDVIEERCAHQLARDDVRVCGHVGDVRSLYQEADVFVVPSLEEGDPLVTYEAAASGLPIIATPMGATRMGQKEGCVRMVDRSDPASLAEAIHQLASSPDERSSWADRAAQAVQNYDWTTVGRSRAQQLTGRGAE